MKELSVKEKAKRYDEVVNKLKGFMAQGVDPLITRADVQDFFPELAESEDERIRKELIENFKFFGGEHLKTSKWGKNDDLLVTDILAWLEKQGGEKDNLSIDFVLGYLGIKPAYKDGNAWCILLGDNIQEGICGFGDTKEEALIAFIKELIEKKGTPTELSEEEQNRFAKCVLTSCASSFINYLDAHKYEGKMCVSNGECEDIENAFHNTMWDKLHRYYCKYIEKQGEQNPVTDFSDLRIWKYIVDAVLTEKEGIGQYLDSPFTKEVAKKLQKRFGDIDQKSNELPNGDDYGIDSLWHAQRILKKTLGKVEGYQSDDGILEHECAISAVKKLYEQKSVWSEEDDEMVQVAINACNSYQDSLVRSDSRFDKAVKAEEWLKDLKDRVHPQPKQEWNEEDKRSIRDSIFYLKSAKKYFEKDDDILWDEKWFNLCIEFLEALYKKLQPQSQWKPSDEQMKVLDVAIKSSHLTTAEYNGLVKLREQLKSL